MVSNSHSCAHNYFLQDREDESVELQSDFHFLLRRLYQVEIVNGELRSVNYFVDQLPNAFIGDVFPICEHHTQTVQSVQEANLNELKVRRVADFPFRFTAQV